MYTCDLQQSEAVNIAVAETHGPMVEVPANIPVLLEKVATYLTSNGYAPGACYVVYDEFTDDAMRMRAGFAVSQDISESDDVKVMQMPANTTAHTTHYGSYDGIPAAHQAVREWCAANGHEELDMSWEIYGEWYEDESKLVTDIHVAVAT